MTTCYRAETSSSSEDEITAKPQRHRQRVSSDAKDAPQKSRKPSDLGSDKERRSVSSERPSAAVPPEQTRVENGDDDMAAVGDPPDKPKVWKYFSTLIAIKIF